MYKGVIMKNFKIVCAAVMMMAGVYAYAATQSDAKTVVFETTDNPLVETKGQSDTYTVEIQFVNGRPSKKLQLKGPDKNGKLVNFAGVEVAGDIKNINVNGTP